MKREKRTEIQKNSILNNSSQTREEFQRRYGSDNIWEEHKKKHIERLIPTYNSEFSVEKCQEDLHNQIKNIKGYFINKDNLLERIK